MSQNKNDDMAGIISEPRSASGAPDVKPARRLWPRPYDDIKIEPSLDPVSAAPAISIEPRTEGDFETVPAEGYQEAETRREPEFAIPELPMPGLPAFNEAKEELAAEANAPEEAAAAAAEFLAEATDTEPRVTDPAPEDEPRGEDIAVEPVSPVDAGISSEPVAEEPRSVEEALATHEAEAEAAPEVEVIAAEPEPQPALRPRRISVLDADTPAADIGNNSTGGRGRSFAIAAGILLALLVGGGGLVYALSGSRTPDGPTTTMAVPTAEPVAIKTAEAKPAPVADDRATEDLRAIRDHLDQLEQRFASLESRVGQGTPAASGGDADRLAALTERLDKLEQANRPVAAVRVIPPATNATPSAPPRQNAATPPAPAERATPMASTPGTVGSIGSAPAVQAAAPPTPPALPQPRPPVSARADSTPPPSVDPDPPGENVARASPDNPVINGWVVRDIYNGMAVLQSSRGMIEVEPGDELPDGNRVLAIRRLGGNWVVVTERGLIASR